MSLILSNKLQGQSPHASKICDGRKERFIQIVQIAFNH